MSELQKVLNHLAELDVGFYVRHATAGGQAEVPMTPAEVVLYANDPVEFLAKRYGVSKADYLGWHQDGYRVICSAKTSKKKQCKASVAGLSGIYDPKVWAKHQGEYCTTHGGANADEARGKRWGQPPAACAGA